MIKNITSKDNKKIKFIRSLKKTKFRNKENKFLVEGIRIVDFAIDFKTNIDCIIIREDLLEQVEILKLIEKVNSSEFIENYKQIELISVDKNIFSDISDTENSQGIVAVIECNEKKEIANSKKILDESNFVLVLDRIQDPGNMGTIIRTADAAGVEAIIILKGCVDIYNSKVLRSTMGSILNMNFLYATEEESVKILKENNYEIISSYLKTENYYDTVSYKNKSALVIGNEGNGISDFIIENSDVLVKIPIYGAAESLNAAISSGILMYEISKTKRG